MKKTSTFCAFFVIPSLVTFLILNSAFAQQSTVHLRNQTILQELRQGNFEILTEASSLNYLNDFISDLGVLSPGQHGTPMPVAYSRTVQVCASNLANVAMIPPALGAFIPAEHVAILIDGYQSFKDPGGGDFIEARVNQRVITCQNVPLYTAINDFNFSRRVECIGNAYSRLAIYSFFKYNCAGFVRDILRAAGSELPTFPNLGIGIRYRTPDQTSAAPQSLWEQIEQNRNFLFGVIAPGCWEKFGITAQPDRK